MLKYLIQGIIITAKLRTKEVLMDKINLVCDIDGISTGEHFYSAEGKMSKSFGSNEKDAKSYKKNI